MAVQAVQEIYLHDCWYVYDLALFSTKIFQWKSEHRCIKNLWHSYLSFFWSQYNWIDEVSQNLTVKPIRFAGVCRLAEVHKFPWFWPERDISTCGVLFYTVASNSVIKFKVQRYIDDLRKVSWWYDQTVNSAPIKGASPIQLVTDSEVSYISTAAHIASEEVTSATEVTYSIACAPQL